MQIQHNKIYFYLSCCALGLVLLTYMTLLIMPESVRLPNYPNSDFFMQVTGYLQLILLLTLITFQPLKKILSDKMTAFTLNVIHATLGVSFILVNIVHITKLPVGYLLILHVLLSLTIVSGAGLLVLKNYISPSLRAITLNVHISLSFITLTSALIHIYFVYFYTAAI